MSDTKFTRTKVLDPRILQQEPVYKIEQGAQNVSYQKYQPNNASINTLSYNINPPSSKVITDRIIKYDGSFLLASDVELDTSSAGADTTLEEYKGQPFLSFGLNSTLIDHPLNHCFETTQVQINNVAINNNTGNNFDILKWMMNDPNDGLQKGTPSRLELYQNYSGSSLFPNSNMQGISQANLHEAPPNGAFEGVVFCDHIGNPLSGDGVYTVNNVSYAYRNGAPVTCDSDGAITGTEQILTTYKVFIKLTLVERAFISPFIFNETHDAQTGLYNISKLDISHNLKQPTGLIKIDTNSAFFSDGTNSLSLKKIETSYLNNNPWKNLSLNMTYRTPSIWEKPPEINTVPYTEYQTFKTTRTVNLQKGQKTSITSDNKVNSTIPNMILIAVRPSSYSSDENMYFNSINRISIDYGNTSSILNTASKQELYEMSYKNGVKMTRAMWYGHAMQNMVNYDDARYTTSRGAGTVPLVGGFVAIVPGVDFPLDNDLSGGVGLSMNFNVTVEFENQLSDVLDSVEIVTIFVNSGFIMCAEGNSSIQLMPITRQEVVDTTVDMDGVLSNVMVGGSFFGKIGSFLKKNVWNPVKKLAQKKEVRDFIKDQARNSGNKYARIGADVADSVGLGIRTGGKKAGLMSLYR